MDLFPAAIAAAVRASFVDRKAYGQVSTASSAGVQSVRTVHLHCLEDRGGFAFSTHAQSQKARDVADTRELAGCYWDEKAQVQFRWRARAAPAVDPALLGELWNAMREETRLAYVLDHRGVALDAALDPVPSVEERPPTHAAVLFYPEFWDVHRFDPRGYRFGRRTQHSRENGFWSDRSTHLIW